MAANLVLHNNGTITQPEEGNYISLEERLFGGGGWLMLSVENDPNAVINRSYADTRYLLRSAGVTATHTVQAGDVLQIQNGIITAINP